MDDTMTREAMMSGKRMERRLCPVSDPAISLAITSAFLVPARPRRYSGR